MPAHIRRNEFSSKSLFTAVLYSDVPESSALSSTGERSIYLKQIRREHLARASMEEVGSQLADTPDPKSITKVAQLTERANRAYSEANGNPADGRWIFVSDLLRLHCTRGGRHWIGTNTSVEAPVVPEHLRILPKKSGEWKQLDRKRKEEEEVKSRVQRWITTAEFDLLTPETTIMPESTVNEQIPFTQASLSVSQRPIQTKQTILKAAYDPANSMIKSGFPVVKRSHVARKGKQDLGVSRRSASPRLPSQQSHATNDKPNCDASQRSCPSPVLSVRHSSVHNAEPLSDSKNSQPLHEHHQPDPTPADPLDIPASSFLPPSFSASQIQTSTPRPDAASEAQKQPTTFSEHLHSTSADVMEAPRPAVENSHISEPFHLQDGQSRKRVRSPLPAPGELEPARKRARISEDADPFSSPPRRRPDVEEMPSTPPNRNLPRLADLLASAKSQKPSPRKKSFSSNQLPPPVEDATEAATHTKPSTSHQGDSRKMEIMKELTPPLDAARQHSIPDSDSELNPHPLMAEVNVDVRVEAIALSTHETKAPEQIPENLMKDRRMNADSGKVSPLPDQLVPQSDLRQLDILPTEEQVLVAQESRPQTPDPPLLPTPNPVRFPFAEADPSQEDLEPASYNLYGLDNLDNPSPAKSLSSLAGSDSESGSEEEEDGDKTAGNIVVSQEFGFVGHEFNPPFTSTQKSGLGTVKDVIGKVLPSDWLGEKLPSTSQLQAEINSQVDEFDKFMEADLSYDPVAL